MTDSKDLLNMVENTLFDSKIKISQKDNLKIEENDPLKDKKSKIPKKTKSLRLTKLRAKLPGKRKHYCEEEGNGTTENTKKKKKKEERKDTVPHIIKVWKCMKEMMKPFDPQSNSWSQWLEIFTMKVKLFDLEEAELTQLVMLMVDEESKKAVRV